MRKVFKYNPKNVYRFISFRWLLILSLAFTSCNKDEIGPQGGEHVLLAIDPESEGFFVINEGGFNTGNASLSYVDLTAQTVSNNSYFAINDEPLGDVFQSMNVINNDFYFVINNSQKIIISDSLLTRMDTIAGLESPRYICQVLSDKAYVTDLYGDIISIVDLNTNEIIGSISVGGWTEEIVTVGNRVFVQDNENSKLLVINPETDLIENEIQLSEGISNMIVANDNSIWVLCDGGFVEPINPKLFQIDTQNFTVIQSFAFNSDEASPRYLTYNSVEDELYFYQDGIRKMETLATTLPSSAFIEYEIEYVYGLDFDDSLEILVVSDAQSLGSQGVVKLFNASGDFLNTFDVGVFPNGIFAMN